MCLLSYLSFSVKWLMSCLTCSPFYPLNSLLSSALSAGSGQTNKTHKWYSFTIHNGYNAQLA